MKRKETIKIVGIANGAVGITLMVLGLNTKASILGLAMYYTGVELVKLSSDEVK